VKDFRSSQEINGETYVCVCCCNYDGMYRSLSCGSNGILRIGVALLVNSDTYYLCFKWKKLAFPRGITHDTSSCFVTVRSVLIVRCFPSTCHPPDHVFLIAFLVQIIFTRKTRTTPPPTTHLPPPWPPASFPTRRRSRSPRPAQMLPPDAGLGHPPPPIDARPEAPGLLRGHREHRLGSHQRRQCVVASIFAPLERRPVSLRCAAARRRPNLPMPTARPRGVLIQHFHGTALSCATPRAVDTRRRCDRRHHGQRRTGRSRRTRPRGGRRPAPSLATTKWC
jgi:hypothetical protein